MSRSTPIARRLTRMALACLALCAALLAPSPAHAVAEGQASGTYVYGSYPDVDGLFAEQAAELDRTTRAAVLGRIQQLIHDKVMVAPIWQSAFLNGVGPRVEESGLGLIAGHAYSSPYEDLRLKAK